MRLSRSSLLLAFPLFLSALSLACGGKVVVDAPTGSGGSGGAGGASQSSTSSVNTSSFVSSTTVGTSSSFVSSSSFVATSTGDVTPGGCDQTGNCQDGQDSCVQCALLGQCSPELQACQSDPECTQYNDCTNNCGGPDCQQACQQKFPSGAKLFFSLVQCAVCQVCPVDCQQFSMGFCP